MTRHVTVRSGRSADEVGVRRVITAGALAVPDDLAGALADERVFVAVRATTEADETSATNGTDETPAADETSATSGGITTSATDTASDGSSVGVSESGSTDDTLLGVIVTRAVPGTVADRVPVGSARLADGAHVAAVAVRRRRRGQGIGSRLVRRVADRTDGPVTARFRPEVRPFYDALGFRIVETDDACVGWLAADA